MVSEFLKAFEPDDSDYLQLVPWLMASGIDDTYVLLSKVDAMAASSGTGTGASKCSCNSASAANLLTSGLQCITTEKYKEYMLALLKQAFSTEQNIKDMFYVGTVVNTPAVSLFQDIINAMKSQTVMTTSSPFCCPASTIDTKYTSDVDNYQKALEYIRSNSYDQHKVFVNYWLGTFADYVGTLTVGTPATSVLH